jgi:cellulose synthase/poly-beta-1,6-N-acetylglucosamine synthase-like glycosyltransferase
LWVLLIGSLFAALAGTVMSRRARLVLLRAAQSAPTWRAPSDGVVRLTVVLPAYNEATRIGPTIERLRDELGDVAENGGLQILVVDDGSTDATADVAREAGAAVVIHPQNRGKGAAVRTGVLAASGRTIAFTDADLAYAPTTCAPCSTRSSGAGTSSSAAAGTPTAARWSRPACAAPSAAAPSTCSPGRCCSGTTATPRAG